MTGHLIQTHHLHLLHTAELNGRPLLGSGKMLVDDRNWVFS